jgi:hypothetical protein
MKASSGKVVGLPTPLIRCGLYRAADSLERLKHLRLAGKDLTS